VPIQMGLAEVLLVCIGEVYQAHDRCLKSRGLIGIIVCEISYNFAILQLHFRASVVWSQS
jgi:hypothetical protein